MNTKSTSVEEATASSSITYPYLWDHYERLLTKTVNESVSANHKTALKAFLSAQHLSFDSEVGTEFNGGFESALELFVSAQARAGLKPSTYKSRVSYLRAIRKHYQATFAPSYLPRPFGEALSRLIANKGLTPTTFNRVHLNGKCHDDLIRRWCTGSLVPSLKRLPLIKEIEELLDVEEGTLSTRLPVHLRGAGQRPTRQTTFGQRLYVSHQKKYGIWTLPLEEEFSTFKLHKSTPIAPEGEKRLKRAVWTSTVGAELPSAGKTKDLFKLFFGYCCLPEDSPDPWLKGQGMKQEHLSLALLANKNLVVAFLEFKRVRSGGKYNGGTLMFIATVANMLRHETGYLYQHPELARRTGHSMSASEWHKQCINTRRRLIEIAVEVNTMKVEGDESNFELGRDPKEPIEKILALKRPLFAILRMLKLMLRDMDMFPNNYSPSLRAEHYRNILLVAMLSANPLRARQFTIMEFDKHLVRESDGSWWIQFNKGEFKNRKSIKSHYRVRVAPNIWPIIERYKTEFRPVLAGADLCNYVFRPLPSRDGGKDNVKPLSISTLYYIVTRVTHRYINGCVGFGPHGFRHIVATDIIKKNPRMGFFLASRALHDKLETVEEEYQHLKTSEFFEPYNDHYAEVWTEVFDEAEKEGE